MFPRGVRNLLFRNLRVLHRSACTGHAEVRVRFAPSPTGFLHLGGLRTALYNFLFAKQHQGSFILRLEDTDRKRMVPGAAEDIQESLKWAGLSPDEIYVQSERLHLYTEVADSLLSSGHAYHCFCSTERLEMLKKESQRTGQVPGYDNRCRHLLPEQVSRHLSEGLPSAIRFRLNPGRESFYDDVFGQMENTPSREGDPVLLKNDGFPTYTLASVVDDHQMRISHVLRGEEWLASTTKHLQLYHALDWVPPRYAHLPLLLGQGGRKLSKRDGDLNKRMGRRLEELISEFNVSRIVTHSALLELDKLNLYSRSRMVHLTQSIEDPKECMLLCEELMELLHQTLGSRMTEKDFVNREYLQRVLHMYKSRVYSVQQLLDDKHTYLLASTTSFVSHEDLNAKLSQLCSKSEDMKAYSRAMKALRLALSALKQGPSVAELLLVLGEQEACVRLQRALEH
ncbi:hypothetical protein DNTS_030353 [Danionella cerebrum]|uniref:Nondiscriminating glutamyl-tRNA synthetase EARS2, mitochondrial n=1 Tax=Danionella cerebrum TaxID=2873325 RepID=A0A553QIW7_9TELE|nr:hypothetical protein DNTS_030353 [Danionella translucida]